MRFCCLARESPCRIDSNHQLRGAASLACSHQSQKPPVGRLPLDMQHDCWNMLCPRLNKSLLQWMQQAAAGTTAASSLTSHLCRLSAVRISLSPSLSQKSTYDERYPPPFIPLSFVFCLCGVEGWRVLPQVEDATAAASLVGLTGEKRGGGCRSCCSNMWLQDLSPLFCSSPPPADARLGKGGEDSDFH